MRAQDSTPAWANKKGHKSLSEQYRSQRQKCPRSRKSYLVAGALPLRGEAIAHRNSESLHAEYYGSQSGAIPRRKPPPTVAAFAASPPGRLPHCPRRPSHRSSLSAPWPFCPSLTAGSHRLCPALRTTEVPSRRETRNRSSHTSCKLPLKPFPKDASLFALSVRHRSTPALRTGTFPVSFPASLQSLFALLMQVPELSSAPVFGISGGQEEMLSQL